MNRLLQSFDDAFCLFYPRLCLACGEKSVPQHQVMCATCEFKLPRTKLHFLQENDFTKKFWGRVHIETGTAFFYFSKKSKTQSLIHNLKYSGKKEVGIVLGQMMGRELITSPLYQDIDLIIPIPLHPKKEIKRGYNQSDVFAEGLSQTTKIPWSDKVLRRKIYTETQTKKSREERFDNVMKAFEVTNPHMIKNKHVLLVDDVLTTGATLEAGATKLLEIEGTKVSMATIAMGMND